jgi:hypothetical protein
MQHRFRKLMLCCVFHSGSARSIWGRRVDKFDPSKCHDYLKSRGLIAKMSCKAQSIA